MASDMLAALGRATVDGHTLFAQNVGQAGWQPIGLFRSEAHAHSAGETLRAQFIQVPQARQTHAAVGCRPANIWGFWHGINEHGLVVGRTSLQSRLHCSEPALTGTDLVRLVLERARSATQAVDVLTDLIERHGQGPLPSSTTNGSDNGFLIADGHEAFLLETAGHHWSCQEVQELRTASDVSTIRQDWDRISRGLATHAIEHGWWPGDGSKLDFAGAVADAPVGQLSGLLRWGRSLLLLEQQSGHIDASFIRRVLRDHYEGMASEVDPLHEREGPVPLCQHGTTRAGLTTLCSMIAQVEIEKSRPVLAWWAFGPPCTSIYLPVFVAGDLPEAFTEEVSRWMHRVHEFIRREPKRKTRVGNALEHLQSRLDQETDEFMAETRGLTASDSSGELPRRTGLFMQHAVELLAESARDIVGPEVHVAAGVQTMVAR